MNPRPAGNSKAGYMSTFPERLIPYAEVIRLDKPGYVYFFIPHLLGALQAATARQVQPDQFLPRLALLLTATVPLTFVNYAWNDLVDADFDRKVTRTMHRPIARGAISKKSAFAFTLFLTMLTGLFLLRLPEECLLYAVPMSISAVIYPLSKRFTDFP